MANKPPGCFAELFALIVIISFGISIVSAFLPFIGVPLVVLLIFIGIAKGLKGG